MASISVIVFGVVVWTIASSEAQGQLVGAGKSLRGREKNSGEEKSRTTSFLTFFRPNFFLARVDFFPPPLTAPGSPRMGR